MPWSPRSRVGDLVLVRPGERLAVDGVVVEGTAAANQAPVTGESLPVAKQPGDQVFAGSIVEGGSLPVRATTAAADNTIAKIVHLVEEAQAQRAPAQTIVDRFAARYTPVVVAWPRWSPSCRRCWAPRSTPGSTAASRCSSSPAPAPS